MHPPSVIVNYGDHIHPPAFTGCTIPTKITARKLNSCRYIVLGDTRAHNNKKKKVIKSKQLCKRCLQIKPNPEYWTRNPDPKPDIPALRNRTEAVKVNRRFA